MILKKRGSPAESWIIIRQGPERKDNASLRNTALRNRQIDSEKI